MLLKLVKKMSVFPIINGIILLLLSMLCILPIMHIIAISFSSSIAVETGKVGFIPYDFTLSAYEFIAQRIEFWRAMYVTIQRVIIGGGISMLLTVLTAYPLSKEDSYLKGRNIFAWVFFITMLVGGGLIPWYMLIKQLNLMDTLWALVLPGAVQVFNIVILLNFFRQLPKALEEAAVIDGASHFIILFKIYIPSAMPALATLTLFTLVGHWNSWFDGLILMNFPEKYPLQTYLQTMIIAKDFSLMTGYNVQSMGEISSKTVQAAQIFLGALPVMLFYPFLQKYFVKGIVLGSVKG